MPIVFRCITCQKTLRVGDDAAGKKARCPDCGTIQDVALPASGQGFAEGLVGVRPVRPSDSQDADSIHSPFAPAPSTSTNPFSDSTPPVPSPAQAANPYASPLQTGGIASPHAHLTHLQRRLLAEQKVKGPALAMIIIQMIVLIMLLFQAAGVAMQGDREMFSIMHLAVSLAMNGLILFGAWKMYGVRGYVWAMAAAILSIIPCTGCCVLSMPIGIWALVVLNDSVVKSAFH